MYKYETHLHTAPVSRCGRCSVEENVAFYASLGYDGIFITNHFLNANISIDKTRPYEEKIEFFFPSYEEQTRISACFKNINNLITLHQRNISLYTKNSITPSQR